MEDYYTEVSVGRIISPRWSVVWGKM